MILPPDLKARVLAAVATEPAPARAAVVRGVVFAWSAATVVTLGIFFVIGGPRVGERPAPFVAATAAGWFAVALVGTWGVARRGSMLGRSRAALLVLSLALPVALLGWYFGCSMLWPLASGPVSMERGWICLVLTLAMGAVPFAVFARSRGDSDPVHPRATGAAIGAMAGAWASVLIGLHCEHVAPLHVIVGHVLPAVVLAAVGAVVGRRVLGMRADPATARGSDGL
jgi:hypothetical protein